MTTEVISKTESPELLLGWATQNMIKLYHSKMVDGIRDGKMPQNGAWSFTSQVSSITQLINYLNEKVTIPLLICADSNVVDQEEFRKLKSNEFLFMMLIKKGDDILHEYVTRVPQKAFGKGGVVDHKTRQIYIDGHAYSRQKDTLIGNNDCRVMSNKEAFSGIDRKCLVCGSKEDLRLCGQCNRVYYCGPDHQKLDWKQHRISCLHQAGIRKGVSVKQTSSKNGFSELDVKAANHDVEIINATDGDVGKHIQLLQQRGLKRADGPNLVLFKMGGVKPKQLE